MYKELNENKLKAAVMIQSQIRGYLARVHYRNELLTRKDNEKKQILERIRAAIQTIQSHWRGYAIRKVYNQLKLERAIRDMQINYFHQQVWGKKIYLLIFEHLLRSNKSF